MIRKPRGRNQQNPVHGKLGDKQPGLFNTSNRIGGRRKERMEKELQTETYTGKTPQPITRCGFYAAPDSDELVNDS